MLDAKYRWVVFQTFNLIPHDDEANFPFKMRSIVGSMQKCLADTEGLVKTFKGGTIALRVRDIQIDEENDVAIILFVYVDKNVSDPAFGHLEKNIIRTEPKLEGEGIALSFHYILSLKKIPNIGYIAVKEQIPGLQSSYSLSFLRNYFKTFGITKSDEDENISSWPELIIDTLASQKLTDDVNTRGVISGLQLIKKYTPEKLDERAHMKENTHRISIKLEKVGGEESLSIVERIINKYSQKFPEARLTIKREEGKSYTVKTKADIHAVKELVYGKTEKIGVGASLPQCSEAIQRDLTTKMIKLLVAEKNAQKKARKENGQI